MSDMVDRIRRPIINLNLGAIDFLGSCIPKIFWLRGEFAAYNISSSSRNIFELLMRFTFFIFCSINFSIYLEESLLFCDDDGSSLSVVEVEIGDLF